ncbi:aldo/keto reductase, partial [Sphingomonas sp. RS2018]
PAGSVPNKGGETAAHGSDGRLNGDNPYGGMPFTEANFHIADELRAVADDLGRPMAQVALAWVTSRPGVSSVLMGASRSEQVTQNAASLDITLSPEQLTRLDAAGAPPMLNPYFIFQMPRQQIFGSSHIRPWEH